MTDPADPAGPAGFWDAEADRFDDEPDHGLRDPETFTAWDELLTTRLPPPPTDVLDLGCGTGSIAVLLALAGHRVRGLDVSPRMAERARSKAAGARVEVPVEVGDATRPPFEPGSADVVWCRHVLWALPDPSDVLRRWAALLRPGGVLALVEGRWHTGGGIAAADLRPLAAEHVTDVVVTSLDNPALWGGPLRDERYLLTARRV